MNLRYGLDSNSRLDPSEKVSSYLERMQQEKAWNQKFFYEKNIFAFITLKNPKRREDGSINDAQLYPSFEHIQSPSLLMKLIQEKFGPCRLSRNNLSLWERVCMKFTF